MMTDAISRKDLLHGLFRPSAHKAEAEACPMPRPAIDPDLAALAADFPTEFLNEEAARLGLDPQTTDRDTLLRAVFLKMQDQRRS
ncbi:MAG: hypothetical protein KDE22_02845 [Rhodobacterales bacterium]|nr:hypothetical protein [Rhodobacterales bacterium]